MNILQDLDSDCKDASSFPAKHSSTYPKPQNSKRPDDGSVWAPVIPDGSHLQRYKQRHRRALDFMGGEWTYCDARGQTVFY